MCEAFVRGPDMSRFPACIAGSEKSRDKFRTKLAAAREQVAGLERELRATLAQLRHARLKLAVGDPAAYWRGLRNSFREEVSRV